MIATTTDCQKLQYRSQKRLYCCFRLSIVVAIDRVSFFVVGVVENPRLAARMSVVSVILWGIEVLPVCMATLLFFQNASSPSVFLRNYDIYHQNSNGDPTAFGGGKLSMMSNDCDIVGSYWLPMGNRTWGLGVQWNLHQYFVLNVCRLSGNLQYLWNGAR